MDDTYAVDVCRAADMVKVASDGEEGGRRLKWVLGHQVIGPLQETHSGVVFKSAHSNRDSRLMFWAGC